VSKFSDQFAAAPVLKPSVVVVVVVPKLFRSSLLPSFLIRTAHVVAWLPAVATLQPLPLLLLLATVACCCCWVLFLFLFVCLLVRFVGIVYICFERRRRVARKKERKKEERVAYSVVVVVAC
jgi:cell division protein FtsL